MTSSLADETGRIMVELHWALEQIDPARWRADAAARLRGELDDIQARLSALTSQDGAIDAAIRALSRGLSGAPDAEASDGSLRARWMAFRRSLVPSYEAARRALRARSVHVPALRGSNFKRGVFHVGSALVALSFLYVVPHPAWTMTVGVPLALIAWTLEIVRRRDPDFNTRIMRFWAPLAHPHEHTRLNSGTWYLTSIALLSGAAAVVGPVPGAVGVAVLGFGDPFAAIVGRRFGRVRLLHGRTLEGSLAFFLVAGVAGCAAAVVFGPSMPLASVLIVGGSGALAGAIAELTSRRIDDNLSVALCAFAAATAAAHPATPATRKNARLPSRVRPWRRRTRPKRRPTMAANGSPKPSTATPTAPGTGPTTAACAILGVPLGPSS